MKRIGKWFEAIIWQSRLVVVVAVCISILSAFALFYMTTIDAFLMLKHLIHYASPDLTTDARAILRGSTIRHVVEIVDGYLLATVLLIFGMGLYELFISKIELALQSESASKILLINSLDDLKQRLAKVIMMILVVRFFEYAISMKFETPLELLQLAGGIALLGLALYLSHLAEHK